MDLSKIKMVVSDMDGTLLNNKHEVSDLFFKLFKELKKRNILFVAASGRQYNSIIDKLAPIKNEIIVVAENGAFVKKSGVELLTTPLEETNVSKILNVAATIPDVHAVLCCKHSAYVSGRSKDFIKMLSQYYTNFNVIDFTKRAPLETLKIALYHFESSENYIYPNLIQLENQLKVKISGPNWVDVSSINAHKGYAIEKLMRLYDIKPNELMVFGDYNNDFEMLALADFSFAMENAHKNIRKIAKYTTTNNDNYGVERILEKLLQQQVNFL